MGNHPWLQAAIWAQDFSFSSPFPKRPHPQIQDDNNNFVGETREGCAKMPPNLRSTREALGKWTTVDGSGTCTTWHISSPLIGSIVPQTSYTHVIIIKSLGEIVHPLDISSCRTVGVSPNLLILIRSPDRLSTRGFSGSMMPSMMPSKLLAYWKSPQGPPNPLIA